MKPICGPTSRRPMPTQSNEIVTPSGVVDVNCKVHDLANLHVAGSSVFPRSDCGNPTFPLIGFAARLGDHLVQRFERHAFD